MELRKLTKLFGRAVHRRIVVQRQVVRSITDTGYIRVHACISRYSNQK